MKRGSIVFADITWFVIFVVLVLFMYFVLFKPLEGKMTNRIEPSKLETDADFIATALPQLLVHTPDKNGRRALYDGEAFSELLEQLIAEYKQDPRNYDNTLAHQDYEEFLEAIIDETLTQQDVPNAHKTLIGYAVFIVDDKKYIEGTCIGKMNGKEWCPADLEGYDPATGAIQPEIVTNSDAKATLTEEEGKYYDFGVSYVPTEHGVLLLETVLAYEVQS